MRHSSQIARACFARAVSCSTRFRAGSHPFALVNRALPNRLSRRLVGYLHPEWLEEDNYGFLAFYNRCYFSAIKDLLDRNGLTNTSFNLLYYQSIYFNFFYPLFVLMLAYDLIASILGIRNLASGIIVTTKRPPAEEI